MFSLLAASTAIPGAALVVWVLWEWVISGVFHSGWALAGEGLVLFSAQAFIVGTVALLVKRSEIRIERLVRMVQTDSSRRDFPRPLE